jgi:CBS domain-containing protein
MMKLKDVMTAQVEVVHPDAMLQEAAKKMKALNVGSLPVCDGQRLVGTLTDRDITIRAVAEGRNPTTTPVRESMTPQVIYCFDDQNVKEAAKLMQDKQIRRLPILNREKQLVGIVSLGDLAVDTGNEKMAGETLTEISQPSQPKH